MALGKRKTVDTRLPARPEIRRENRDVALQIEYRKTAGGERADTAGRVDGDLRSRNGRARVAAFPERRGARDEAGAGGEDPGDPPSKDYREGFRLIVKLLDGDDGSVREFFSTAIAAWAAVDRLHDVYLHDVDKHPGQLPVVELVDVIEIRTASGPSFQPALKIVDWMDRPADMPKAIRGNGGSTHRAVVPQHQRRWTSTKSEYPS